MKLHRYPQRVLVVGLICEFVLLAIYWFDVATAGHFSLVHSLFDLDSEGNIPAWFSSSQLLCVALTYWSIAFQKRRTGRPSRVFFVLAGLAASYASSDETAQIHERITAWVGKRYVDWVVPLAADNFFFVMLVVALLMIICQLLASDLLLLWNNYRRIAVIGALGILIGLTGGMGVETLGYKLLNGQTDSLLYKIEVAAEEFLEMFGASLVLFSALNSSRTKLVSPRAPASTPRLRKEDPIAVS